MWRLEPEGEAEVPEIIIVSDAVDGTPVDLDGESRHEHVEAKLSRRGREMLNEVEEIRNPKREVIRVESEETQDYVKEGRSTEKEEEEMTFVPSAVSVPLKPLFRCDRRSPTEHCDKPRQRKQERSHGRLAGLHQGGQSSRLGRWSATPRHGKF